MTDLTYLEVYLTLLIEYHCEKGGGRLWISNLHIEQLETLLGQNTSNDPIEKEHFHKLLAFITTTLGHIDPKTKSGLFFKFLEEKFKHSNQFNAEQPAAPTDILEAPDDQHGHLEAQPELAHSRLIHEYNTLSKEAPQIAARFTLIKERHPKFAQETLHKLDIEYHTKKRATLKQSLLRKLGSAFKVDTTASQLLCLLTNNQYPALDGTAPISAAIVKEQIKRVRYLRYLYHLFTQVAEKTPQLTTLLDHTKHPEFYHYSRAPSPIIAIIESDLPDDEKKVLITALARRTHHHNIIEFNIDVPANINGRMLNPLGYALTLPNPIILETLIEAGADVNRHDSNNLTPLHRAAQEGNIEGVRTLLKHGAKVDAVDFRRRTPLHLTTNPNIMKLLIEKGANPNCTDHANETPLHKATIRGNFEVMKYLLEQGCSPNSLISLTGETPLKKIITHISQYANSENEHANAYLENTVKPCITLLFDHGADPFFASKVEELAEKKAKIRAEAEAKKIEQERKLAEMSMSQLRLAGRAPWLSGSRKVPPPPLTITPPAPSHFPPILSIPINNQNLIAFYNAHVKTYILKIDLVNVLVFGEPWNTLPLHIYKAILEAVLPELAINNILDMIATGRNLITTRHLRPAASPRVNDGSLTLFSRPTNNRPLTSSTEEVRREKRQSPA